MVIFGVITDNDETAIKFMEVTKQRLADNNLVRNPFTGATKTIKHNEQLLHIISIKPVYLNVSIFSWPMLLIAYIIWGISWFMLPGLIFLSFGFFWSMPFYYIIFKKGLVKAGYSGAITRIKKDDIIKYGILKEG